MHVNKYYVTDCADCSYMINPQCVFLFFLIVVSCLLSTTAPTFSDQMEFQCVKLHPVCPKVLPSSLVCYLQGHHGWCHQCNKAAAQTNAKKQECFCTPAQCDAPW